MRENELGIEKGDETGVNNDRKRKERGIGKDVIAVNSDGKRKERGIGKDEIAVNNVGRQNVSESEKTDKEDEKENYKRKDYDSKTTCQQKLRLVSVSSQSSESGKSKTFF